MSSISKTAEDIPAAESPEKKAGILKRSTQFFGGFFKEGKGKKPAPLTEEKETTAAQDASPPSPSPQDQEDKVKEAILEEKDNQESTILPVITDGPKESSSQPEMAAEEPTSNPISPPSPSPQPLQDSKVEQEAEAKKEEMEATKESIPEKNASPPPQLANKSENVIKESESNPDMITPIAVSTEDPKVEQEAETEKEKEISEPIEEKAEEEKAKKAVTFDDQQENPESNDNPPTIAQIAITCEDDLERHSFLWFYKSFHFKLSDNGNLEYHPVNSIQKKKSKTLTNKCQIKDETKNNKNTQENGPFKFSIKDKGVSMSLKTNSKEIMTKWISEIQTLQEKK